MTIYSCIVLHSVKYERHSYYQFCTSRNRGKKCNTMKQGKKKNEKKREPNALFTSITSFVVAFPPPKMLAVHYHRHFLLPTAHCLNRQKGKKRRERMVGKAWQRAILWLSQDHSRSVAELRVTMHPRTLPKGPPRNTLSCAQGWHLSPLWFLATHTPTNWLGNRWINTWVSPLEAPAWKTPSWRAVLHSLLPATTRLCLDSATFTKHAVTPFLSLTRESPPPILSEKRTAICFSASNLIIPYFQM